MDELLSRDDAWRRLKPVLRQFTTVPLSEDCRILQDLDIAGDDAGEFLDAVHETFGTRFDGFMFKAYFPDEGEARGESWFYRLGFRDSHKPLTVGHLLDVIQRGGWFEPAAREPAIPSGHRARRYAVRALVTVVMPLAYVLVAIGAGEAFGLPPGVSLLLCGLPVGAVLATILWRRLPAN